MAAWGQRAQYRARVQPRRSSKLDPVKKQVVAWLEAHRDSAMQIVQRLRECGYRGGITIVRDLRIARCVRPSAKHSSR